MRLVQEASTVNPEKTEIYVKIDHSRISVDFRTYEHSTSILWCLLP